MFVQGSHSFAMFAAHAYVNDDPLPKMLKWQLFIYLKLPCKGPWYVPDTF